jgi:hypothetical protein
MYTLLWTFLVSHILTLLIITLDVLETWIHIFNVDYLYCSIYVPIVEVDQDG